MSKSLMVYLDDELKQKIENEKKLNGISLTFIVTKSLELYFKMKDKK